jgi:hypothetical protein
MFKWIVHIAITMLSRVKHSQRVKYSQASSKDIVVYLPHARTVESRKPRKHARNNRITSVYSLLLGDGQCANELISGSHVTCPRCDIPDETIGTT